MRQLFLTKSHIFLPCIVAVFLLNQSTFVQAEDAPEPLTVAGIVADSANAESEGPQYVPFGYVPYPAVNNMPAYGIPYSFPRQRQLRRLGRLTPPPPQAYPLPQPGVLPGYAGPVAAPPMVAPPFSMGQMPVMQETLNVPAAAQAPAEPTVFFRPTPIRNFISLLVAPRPYVGYDPYAVYPAQ